MVVLDQARAAGCGNRTDAREAVHSSFAMDPLRGVHPGIAVFSEQQRNSLPLFPVLTMKRLINPVVMAYVVMAVMFVGINAYGLPGRSTSPWPWTSIGRNPAQTFAGLVPGGLWQPDYAALKRSINGLAGVSLVRQTGNSFRVALGQSPEWIFEGGRKPISLFLTGELWVSRGSSPRTDAEVVRVANIVAAYNQQLQAEGWNLVVVPVPTKLGVHQEWVRWPISGSDLISSEPVLQDRSAEIYGQFHQALDSLSVKNVDLMQLYR